jgi:hypothetical protein
MAAGRLAPEGITDSGRIERRSRKEIDGSEAKQKPDITAIKAVIQFVKATQRLQPQTITDNEEE